MIPVFRLRMRLICYVLYSFLLFIAVKSQTVGTILQIKQFDQSLANTRCKSGLIENTDSLIAYVTADTRTINLNSRNQVFLQHKPPNTYSYKTICSINLNTIACAAVDSRDTCYCKDNRSSVITLVMNVTAAQIYSQTSVRSIWPLVNSDLEDRSTEVQAPKTYALEQTALYVDQIQQDIGLQTVLKLMFSINHNLAYCVRNLIAKNVSIWYENRRIATTKDDCVPWEFSFTSEDHGKTIKLEYIELTECGRVGNVFVTLIGFNPPTQEANAKKGSSCVLTMSFVFFLLIQILL